MADRSFVTLGRFSRLLATISLLLVMLGAQSPALAQYSVARHWNEETLEAIRDDLARPTVHARNLFHVSAAMYDAWAAYDDVAETYLHHERASSNDTEAARREAISFAAYRLLTSRFSASIGAEVTVSRLDQLMEDLGYDRGFVSLAGSSPSALGNRIAQTYIQHGLTDGANELLGYSNQHYEPVNRPLLPNFPGNPNLVFPNRWQPLTLEVFIDQSGNPFPGATPEFLSPEWGSVVPFALRESDKTVYERDGFEYQVYHDPGPPPLLGSQEEEAYLTGFEQVLEWSSLLDPTQGELIDISPGAIGNNSLGTNDGDGHALNPTTGMPYEPQVVPAGDYYRVLAEFWADGPDSETPPGHWFTIANYVSDHAATSKQFGGSGPVLGDLEWDIKLYFTLGGAMHDSAVAAWGIKGWYDYIRPISAIRYMGGGGQRSDRSLPSYSSHGLELVPGRVEVVTEESSAPGGHHYRLGTDNIGRVAVRAWRGPLYISNPETTSAGVGWILPENWWPYQRPSFVTPPFAGYVSGHSTYSRAAAEVLELVTGSPYFPGGLGEFPALQNEFLVFEEGPSVDVVLQWATYADASDECSLSRIYGGIHPTADDIPGRIIGSKIGPAAFELAQRHFLGGASGGDVCESAEQTLCLNQGRFRLEITWEDHSGNVGDGQVVPVGTDDSGLFWFFDEDNWEVLVKVLDGCAVNDRFWVFFAATTDVGFSLTVTDTVTGSLRVYQNTRGQSAPAVTDTSAFATCSG